MKVAVIGLGHIGGSLTKALLSSGVDVVGYDIDKSTLTSCGKLGISCTSKIDEALDGAQVVFLAVPTPVVLDATREILAVLEGAQTIDQDVIVSDLSSSKTKVVEESYDIVEEAKARGVRVEFLSLHPMTGREGSGFMTSEGDLILGCTWAVILHQALSAVTVVKVADLLSKLQARLLFMDWESHERAVGALSHLPHLISLAYASLIYRSDESRRGFILGAGSFRDMTRVAYTDPEKVAAMVVPNSKTLSDLLDRLNVEIESIRSSLSSEEEFVRSFSQVQTFLRNASELTCLESTSTLVCCEGSLFKELQRISQDGSVVLQVERRLEDDSYFITFLTR